MEDPKPQDLKPKSRAIMEERWMASPDNPFNWPMRKKVQVMTVGCILTFASGINATSIATPGTKLAEAFDLGDGLFPTPYWPVTSWALGGAIGPMLGMPLLENFGTRKLYTVVYIAFTLFLIPQAVAQNFATLIVTRFFAGFFGGILQNGLEAILADLFKTDEERSMPVTVFTFLYIAGVTLGPTYAAIFPADEWRWVFYAHLIAFGAFFPIFCIAMKETRGPVIIAALAKRQQVEGGTKTDTDLGEAIDFSQVEDRPPLKELFYDAIVRPFVMLATEPVTFLFTLWAAFCIGLVYIFTESIDVVYRGTYGFSERQVGLVQAAVFIGELLGFVLCLPQNALFQRSGRWNKEAPGIPSPEARLILSIPASFIGLAGGLFWYAWTSYSFLSWVVPSIGLVLVGCGIMVVVTAACMYLTDAYTTLAASSIGAVALLENLFAGLLPLSTPRMYATLGTHWGSSLLGFVALALSLVPVPLMMFGPRIRSRSRYMASKR